MKTGWLAKILKNPEAQQLINDNDFTSLYSKLDKYLEDAPLRDVLETSPLLTDVLLWSGIDPLEYMDRIPADYRRGAPISSFKIPNHIRYIGESAFKGCKLLDSINIPGSVERIRANAFEGCSSLRNIIFNPGLKSIGRNAFRRCKALRSMDLPSTLEILEDFAFTDTELRTLKIPKSLKYIGSTLFAGEEAPDIYYEGTAEEFKQLVENSGTFPVPPGIDGHFKIICSDQTLIDTIGN